MKKTLILADIHAHNYKENSTLLANGLNSRLAEIVCLLDQTLEIAEAQGVERILICGDTFHTRGNVRPSVQNEIKTWLESCVASEIDVFIIPGNHDLENYKHGATAVDIFDGIGTGWASVRVAPAGVPIYWPEDKIIGIPYIHDIQEFKDAIQAAVIDYPDAEVIMMHQGIDDFAGHGYGETTITAKFLEEAVGHRFVFSGHYHTPGNYKHLYFSVGAPCEHNFGDEADKRGFLLLNTDYTVHEHYETLIYPKFVTVSDTYMEEEGDSIIEMDVEGNFIRLNTSNIKTAERDKERLMDFGAANVVVNVTREFAKAHVETISMGKPEEMVTKYIDITGGEYGDKKADILALFKKIIST